MRVGLKAPKADDLLHRLPEALAWIDRIRRWSDDNGCDLEIREVRSRSIGQNDVPSAVRIASIEELGTLVGRAADIAAFDRILATTNEREPLLVGWVGAHPSAVVPVAADWPRLLDVIGWVADHDTSKYYLRHLDLPGIDTKFVEHHRKLLGQLLQVVLLPERVNLASTQFASRFGFKTTPNYIRLRLLGAVHGIPPELTELSLRSDELARLQLPVRTVFVVENQASYLAFPDVPDSIVVFGEGFKVGMLDAVPWLAERAFVYWGDIDTHGFRILDQLRARVDNVRSMLMDEATLTDHLDRAVVEDAPTAVTLSRLTPSESELYLDLVEGRFGPSVRLEQERIRFSAVRSALAEWQPGNER